MLGISKVPRLNHAFKTALAASIATALVLLLHLPKGYWAVISAVIVMHSNIETGVLESTKKAAINRIVGTVIGVGIGLLILCFHVQSLLPNLLVIFLLTVILTVLSSYYKVFSMATITALIIIMVGMQTPEPWVLALQRALNIIIGVAVAIVVTIYVLPYRSEEHLYKKMTDILTLLHSYFGDIMQGFFNGGIASKELSSLKNNYIKLMAECRKTLANLQQNTQVYGNFTEIISLARRIFVQLENLEEALVDAKTIIGENADLLPNISNLQQELTAGFADLIRCFASYPQKTQFVETSFELQAYEESVAAQRTMLKKRQISTSLEEIYHFSTFIYGLKHLLNLIAEGKKLLLA